MNGGNGVQVAAVPCILARWLESNLLGVGFNVCELDPFSFVRYGFEIKADPKIVVVVKGGSLKLKRRHTVLSKQMETMSSQALKKGYHRE